MSKQYRFTVPFHGQLYTLHTEAELRAFIVWMQQQEAE